MKSASPNLSNNQIDKLGERLKTGSASDANFVEDVTMLSSYRNSFAEPAKAVADKVREVSGLEVTSRSLKTTLSIVAKLRRDGVKQLSAMQDIGGCRVTVGNLAAQNELTEKLMSVFPDAKLYDRVAKPSHGYRAKHLVVKVDGKRIEIQIRTRFQHLWALLSEDMADMFGQEIKYGTGDKQIVQVLMEVSEKSRGFDQSHDRTSVPLSVMNSIELRVQNLRQEFLEMKKFKK